MQKEICMGRRLLNFIFCKLPFRIFGCVSVYEVLLELRGDFDTEPVCTCGEFVSYQGWTNHLVQVKFVAGYILGARYYLKEKIAMNVIPEYICLFV